MFTKDQVTVVLIALAVVFIGIFFVVLIIPDEVCPDKYHNRRLAVLLTLVLIGIFMGSFILTLNVS